MSTLQGKTVLVTGASRGIGRATATVLARAGAHVLVHYGRSAQEAESLVSEIQSKGGRAEAISADLGTPNGAALLAKQVRTTAFPSADQNRNTPFGLTKILMRRSPPLKNTWRSIRHGLMQSRWPPKRERNQHAEDYT